MVEARAPVDLAAGRVPPIATFQSLMLAIFKFVDARAVLKYIIEDIKKIPSGQSMFQRLRQQDPGL
jgi:hypothetical protein